MNSYHTHTFRCKHATGEVHEYVAEAMKKNSTHVGITDHTPLPDNRWHSVRMRMDELEGYLLAIETAKAMYPGITVYAGLECEYANEYASFYQDHLIGKCRLNYLIGGAHFFPFHKEWANVYEGIQTPKQLTAYADYVISSIRSGLFAFIAHPDLFANSYLRWDADAKAASMDILSAAESCRIPLELNCYGFRKPFVSSSSGKRPAYPLEEFWALASGYQIMVVVNADAHKPDDIIANMDQGLKLAQKYNLNVIDLSSFL
ncbi:MAG: histidinol-phosphatase [Spirochaetales bacterium]|nr:histidinol-phosphatase [Spirochaetales bacterium]